MPELQTMPLRFRVWDEEKKEFVLEDADLDEYSSLWAAAGVGGITEVVSQDTGLKDKNGRRIYTGDIIVDHSYLIEYTHKLTGAVVASDVVAGYTIAPALNGWKPSENIVLSKTNTYEVIGNIWQNPELLEK